MLKSRLSGDQARSDLGADRMLHEEVPKSPGHATWILYLKEVRCIWKDKSLDMWQPFQKHTVRFPKAGRESFAATAEDGKSRLGDALRCFLAKTPVQQSRQLHFERSRCIGNCLLEGPRYLLVEVGAISVSRARLQEFINDLFCRPLPETLLAVQK